MVSDIVNHRQKNIKTHTYVPINLFRMSASFTHAHTYESTNVSKPARLKVNTPVLCTSQIRQFERGGHCLFSWEKALTSTSERGNLFVCCDWVCAQLNLRQNKYICHIVRKGRRRQSWIEDKKEERIKSVTRIFSNSNPAALHLTAAELSCLYIPPNPHKCLHFHQRQKATFLTFFILTCI